MEHKVYTSISLSEKLKTKLKRCVQKLDVDEAKLLSVLCYKAGKYVSTQARCLQTVDYQDRGQGYEITPVWFFASDHEYMHACRLSSKTSVSKLLACAMAMFLDEIMEKGINQLEIAKLRVIKNSYNEKFYNIRNYIFNIHKNDQFEEYIMKMRFKKRRPSRKNSS